MSLLIDSRSGDSGWKRAAGVDMRVRRPDNRTMSSHASTSIQESSMTAEQGHPAFEHLRTAPIDALNIEVAEYRHRGTGALHYHLAADKPENVFLVGLRTVPTDSTGVAHILEHTVLCGSERYPVRDPFFMMIRRSLNTFMNAFTAADWTAYPFATQNRKDYFNLLDVYLDAVFFSRLEPLDFAQEGHRVEFARPDDPTSDLVFKGVVYNEMKGAMSSPVSVLWQTLSKHPFPRQYLSFQQRRRTGRHSRSYLRATQGVLRDSLPSVQRGVHDLRRHSRGGQSGGVRGTCAGALRAPRPDHLGGRRKALLRTAAGGGGVSAR